MGNASGKKDGEGPSEVKDEEGGQQDMEFVRDEEHSSNRAVGMYAEPIFQSLPYGPTGYQPTLTATPPAPIVGIPRSRVGGLMHMSNYTSFFDDAFDEKPSAVMITWSYGGNQVAVTGSWDNWERREPMYRSGQDFIILKKLQSGVYHFRFVVDEQFRYAPDLPWELDVSGAAFNILDVQDTVPDAPENLSEFKSPPSPESSYDNESLNEDFSKAPPEMPPQLLKASIIEPSTSVVGHRSLPRPNHAVLNHLNPTISKSNG